MKYYAVTEDPNELLHYGVKGMKWGQHIFGKERSPGYHRALGKLRSSVKRASSAIRKSSTQRAMAKEQKLQNKFAQAVAKTQKRIRVAENLHNLSNLESYEQNLKNQYRSEKKAAKAAIKQNQKFIKNERKMDKLVQQAREGKLKYGQLSDDQVRRVTDRLALERNARVLGSTEKPKFRTRMKDALQEGMLKGVVEGTAAGMREIAVAKVQNRLENKKVLDKKAKQEAARDKETSRIKNKKTKKEMREDLKDETYEAELREGESVFDRGNYLTVGGAAKKLQKLNRQKSDREFAINEAHNLLQGQRQDRQNEERAERQRQLAGKMAYEWGYLPAGSIGGGNNNQGQEKGKNKGNDGGKKGLSGLSNDKDEVKAWSDWYRKVYIDKETNQQRDARLFKESAQLAKTEKKQAKKRLADDIIVRRKASRKLNDNRVGALSTNGVTIGTLYTPYMQEIKRLYGPLRG